LPENIVYKNLQNAQILHDICPKNFPDFFWRGAPPLVCYAYGDTVSPFDPPNVSVLVNDLAVIREIFAIVL